MTSLYDQFFSETNINHIYNILKNIVKNEFEYNIENDEINFTLFKTKMSKIFNDTNKLTLDEINKDLLSEMINYFIQKIKDEEKNKIDNKNNNDIDLMDEYNKFILQRDDVSISLENNLNNPENSITDAENGLNSIDKNLISNEITTVKKNKKKKKKSIMLSSKDRINKESNRFNYKIQSPIDPISELDSLIIPIEETIHFTSPMLKIKIEEVDLDILLTCTNILEVNNYKYGIYKPEKHLITKTSSILTISIESIYGKEEYDSDIVTISLDNDDNKIKLDDVEDFNTGDILILSSKDLFEFSKIVKKDNRSKTLDMDEIINFKEGDEISILNSNLQNTLIFK
tara:strand:- start:3852 stop:4880 length:1029 start_codon:yes stop_codon:yes gene_type:complete